ncbi:MAG: hypothetical protein IIC50_19030 [Planctomycetes bacterium]|nr:hypothetical protein [Planctomycetota bacterium]
MEDSQQPKRYHVTVDFPEHARQALVDDPGWPALVEGFKGRSRENRSTLLFAEALATLAGPVSQLQFTCYDDNDLSTAITHVNSIRCVKIETTVINAAAEGQDKVFTTSAYLRSNGLAGTLRELAQNI